MFVDPQINKEKTQKYVVQFVLPRNPLLDSDPVGMRKTCQKLFAESNSLELKCGKLFGN